MGKTWGNERKIIYRERLGKKGMIGTHTESSGEILTFLSLAKKLPTSCNLNLFWYLIVYLINGEISDKLAKSIIVHFVAKSLISPGPI